MHYLISEALDRALCCSAVLLTANRRLARAFLEEFGQRRLSEGRTGWATPSILTLNAWLASLLEDCSVRGGDAPGLLDDFATTEMWRRLIEESPSVDVLNTSGLASALESAWRTEREYRFDPRSRQWPRTDDQRRYADWSVRFAEICAQMGVIDSARLADWVTDHTASLKRLPKLVLLYGFTDLTPQQQRLFDALRSHGVTIQSDYRPPDRPGKRRLLVATDASHELRCCAAWVRERLQHAPSNEPLPSVGVVIPDLQVRRSDVLRCFDEVFFPGATPAELESLSRPYDVSLGLPLTSNPAISDALLVLRLAFGTLTSGETGQLLMSPYLDAAEREHSARATLDATLRSQGVRALNLSRLTQFTGPTTAALRKLLRSVERRARSRAALPSEWVKTVISLLEAAGWPGQKTLGSAEYQAIEAWRQSVESLASYDGLLGRCSALQLLSLLERLTVGRLFQPEAENTPVRLLGLIESIGLRFDMLWVTGLDDDSWPMRTYATAFLPLRWQKEVGVPGASSAVDLQHAERILADWMIAADEVCFSYPQSRDGNSVGGSRLLPRWPLSTGASIHLPPTAAELIFKQSELEAVNDAHGPPLIAGARVHGGARLIEDQAYCPFRGFVLHRLRIQVLEEPSLGLDAREKGNFFHSAMQHVWAELGSSSSLQSLDEKALRQRVKTAIRTAMQDVRETEALLSIERHRLEVLMMEWFDKFERHREPFTIEALESSGDYEFEGLRLRLTVDRIDQVEGRGRLIIDYKTGRNQSLSSWAEERITSPQLPLYAVLQPDVIGVSFAQVVRHQTRVLGFGATEGLLPGLTVPSTSAQEWDDKLQQWRAGLSLLVSEVRSGCASVTPLPKACRFCPLPPLCRIQQVTEDSDDSETDVIGDVP